MATSVNAPAGDMVPVYLPFATFRSAVQSLRAHGLPDKIDKTAWQSRSGSDQTQILSAFRFLGLINSFDDTQDSLRKLVDAHENTDEERQILADLLREKYARVFELNLKTATPGALSDAIGSYGANGVTRKRAVRFFIKAASHAGIPMSTRFTENLRENRASETEGTAPNNGESGEPGSSQPQPPPAPRQQRRRRRQAAPPPPTPPVQHNAPTNAMKEIRLPKVDGSLAITGTFNPFGLVGDERDLVYKIIDMMNDFEQKNQTASE